MHFDNLFHSCGKRQIIAVQPSNSCIVAFSFTNTTIDRHAKFHTVVIRGGSLHKETAVLVAICEMYDRLLVGALGPVNHGGLHPGPMHHS